MLVVVLTSGDDALAAPSVLAAVFAACCGGAWEACDDPLAEFSSPPAAGLVPFSTDRTEATQVSCCSLLAATCFVASLAF